MRFTRLQLAGIFAATLVCGAANARQLEIDNWQQIGSLVNSTSVTVVPGSSTLFGGPLAGVSALGFSPGTSTAGYSVASIAIPSNQIEYAFGGTVGIPSEQIVLTPGAISGGNVSSFTVAFNYDADGSFNGTPTGGTGETASLSINGVTYTANNPGALTNTNGVFDFVGGALSNMSAILTGWTSSAGDGGGGGGGGGGGTMSAPEIDPASTTSALTLLAGGLMILAGSTRRKLARKAS